MIPLVPKAERNTKLTSKPPPKILLTKRGLKLDSLVSCRQTKSGLMDETTCLTSCCLVVLFSPHTFQENILYCIAN
jgi:hypothetical protein